MEEEKPEYKRKYGITVSTADQPGAGTDEDVYIRFLCKDDQVIGDWLLDIGGWNDCERGDGDTYYIELEQTAPSIYSDLRAIYLYVKQFKGSDDAPAWLLQLISIFPVPQTIGYVMHIPINKWIGIPDRVPNGDSRCINHVVIDPFGELISIGVDPNPGQTFPVRQILNGWREHE
ncbi:PLAT/LH2 domain-containing protein [Paenibacillus polymyxa]|uniref:PLAT/LH2 domain-containing protein n=1 Tax=Paenibacillus polymyxa TaxID=1406 RepID=UPI000589BD9B|nr:PLAT/LH2 domain-containing protein [Paenibacillus polymyxa]AJE54200.1 hypothetical protein RE92_24715 [Paenibacillus polymyxa]